MRIRAGGVDDGFPAVTFYFENSLSLKVYPHDYLFVEEDFLCFGWQNNGLDSLSTMDTILLGGSSTIKLRDEITGSVHLVGPHSIPSAGSRIARRHLLSLLVIALIHRVIS
ncbi:putative aspartic peptidase A1 family, aspartic peptidase domain superfamily [Helianthus anomalus]